MRMKTSGNDNPTQGRTLGWALTVAFLVLAHPAVRGGFCAVGCSGPILAFEGEPFARLELQRGPDLSAAETWEYSTQDALALAGVDYVALRGTVTFAVGQETTTVEVPLIDNGLLDGPRHFRLVTRRGQFFDERLVEIQDNELRSVVDPLYVPEPGPGWEGLEGLRFAAPLPAGRIVALDGRRMITVLGPDGSVEHTFVPAPGRACVEVESLHALPDGRILVGLYVCGEPDAPGQLLRFLPNGTFDLEYPVPGFGGVVAVQPDGKVLVRTVGAQYASSLVRFNLDGSRDTGFLPYAELGTLDQVTIMNDGRILVGGNSKGDAGPILVRLNEDGSPDRTFSLRTSGSRFLLRADGRLIVGAREPEGILQVDPDGNFDPSFGLDPLYGFTVPPFPAFEGSESRLLAVGSRSCSGPRFVAQWNAAGRLDWEISFGGGFGPCFGATAHFLTTTSGQVLMVGRFSSVGGYPRRGLARLLPNPPERQFRVVTPARFRPSVKVASVRVVRTGTTTVGATVGYRTRDATAVAGRDYVAQSGRLDFAPLEVSQEIRVPLLPGHGRDERRSFHLELDQPSLGYAFVEATPVQLLPDLGIAPESLRPRADGSIVLTLRGTLPGRWYVVESSRDLKTWESWAGSPATGRSLALDPMPAPDSPSFFRALGDE